MKKSLSVIIPNYNGRQLLEAYLPSVFSALRTLSEYELIIVDDASTDESVAFLKEKYPAIRLIINPANKGFSYSCNQGIMIAEYDYILLLNSDVRLTHDYLKDQWKYFEKSDTFGVMGRIMSADGSQMEDTARQLYYNGCRFRADILYFTEGSTPAYTAYLSGANALIDSAKLRELGGFNEIFSPFYSEDFDLSLRAWRIGWKCYYEHNSVCFHQVSASTKTQVRPHYVKQIYYRNRFILQKIHLEGVRETLWPIQLWLKEIFPKLLLGKFWVLKSLQGYYDAENKIDVSKNNIKNLQKSKQIFISIDDVIKKIHSSMKDIKIVRFW